MISRETALEYLTSVEGVLEKCDADDGVPRHVYRALRGKVFPALRGFISCQGTGKPGQYVPLSNYMPPGLKTVWLGKAPFNWGDNDASLVKASRIVKCMEVSPRADEVHRRTFNEVREQLRLLGDTLVNLET